MMCFIHQKGRYAPHKILPKFLASAFKKAAVGDIVSRFLSSLFSGRAFLRLLSCCMCFLLFGLPDARSQSLAEGGGEVRPLQIGDTIPKELWDMPLQVVNHPEGKETITLNDYRDKELIILDFWATWCMPCIAMFPKMDSLQNKYFQDIVILNVSNESPDIITAFLERRKQVESTVSNLTSLYDKGVLKKIFPHSSIPHYVWIDGRGKVLAFTETEEIRSKVIEEYLQGKNTINSKSTRIKRFPTEPVFYEEQLILDKNLWAQRVLTDYIDDLHGGSVITVGLPDSSAYTQGKLYRMISSRNLTIPQLYQIAFSDNHRHFNWSNTELKAKDTTKLRLSNAYGDAYDAWKKQGNAFCYELVLHKDRDSQAKDMMLSDLRYYFPAYEAYVEKKMVSSFCMVRTSKTDKIRSYSPKKENSLTAYGGRLNQYYMSTFVAQIYDIGFQHQKKPFINLTDYHHPVDITINCKISDLQALNKELAKYDLQIVEEDREVEILIVTDRRTTLPN